MVDNVYLVGCTNMSTFLLPCTFLCYAFWSSFLKSYPVTGNRLLLRHVQKTSIQWIFQERSTYLHSSQPTSTSSSSRSYLCLHFPLNLHNSQHPSVYCNIPPANNLHRRFYNHTQPPLTGAFTNAAVFSVFVANPSHNNDHHTFPHSRYIFVPKSDGASNATAWKCGVE